MKMDEEVGEKKICFHLTRRSTMVVIFFLSAQDGRKGKKMTESIPILYE